MKKTIFILSVLFLSQIILTQNIRVKTGIEVLKENNFAPLAGKTVGLITNQTGVDAELNSTIDILFNAPDVKLVALFGPEHGVRGNYEAGQKISSYTDKTTGLKVYSLYGKNKKPSPEMLEGIDVLVYDIQDIGCRSYTYINTLGYAMQAAAENDIEFVVLDRPNPLGGNRIEGNILEPEFKSFIGLYPIPYVYGLTCGELALLINTEGYLDAQKKCKLSIIKMEGWYREMTFNETGLKWVPTSPHIPRNETAMFYVATGIAGELSSVINNGVGYTLPFELFGLKNINLELFVQKLNELEIKGVTFRPLNYKPYYGSKKSETLSGVQIYITDISKVNLISIQFYIIEAISETNPDAINWNLIPENEKRMFDFALGTDLVRNFIIDKKFNELFTYLQTGRNSFIETAKKYYLY